MKTSIDYGGFSLPSGGIYYLCFSYLIALSTMCRPVLEQGNQLSCFVPKFNRDLLTVYPDV